MIPPEGTGASTEQQEEGDDEEFVCAEANSDKPRSADYIARLRGEKCLEDRCVDECERFRQEVLAA